jgi:hypothetical protein
MRNRMLWLMILLVAGTLAALPGCERKEKGQKPSGAAPRAEEKPKAAQAQPRAAGTVVVLTCGMPGHPQFEPGKEPADGKCPVCGMKLVRKEVPAESYWTCPMHPEVRENKPGNCPKCGMKLVEKVSPSGSPR